MNLYPKWSNYCENIIPEITMKNVPRNLLNY